MTADDVTLLQAALAAEHAVVYGYGVLGAQLDLRTRMTAQVAFDTARARRDQLAARLRERGAQPVTALPAYDVSVDSTRAALALAVRLEAGMGVRWRDLVAGSSDPALRRLAVTALVETAVRAASWRERAGYDPVTLALPGQP